MTNDGRCQAAGYRRAAAAKLHRVSEYAMIKEKYV